MRFINFIFAFVFLAATVACNSGTQGSGDNNGQDSAKVDNQVNEDLPPPIDSSRVGTYSRNYDYQLDGPRQTFNRGEVKFSVDNLEEMRYMLPDSVPWRYALAETRENGPIIFYFLRGEPTELGATHSRVEYVAKTVPGAGTVDSLLNWLKSLYLNEERQGKLLSEGVKIKTQDGQEVDLLEIRVPAYNPNDTSRYSSKTMAWAYVDMGERYVALNMTSTESGKYDKRGAPAFKKLVASFRKED